MVVVLLIITALLPVPYVRYRPAGIMNALGDLDGQQVISIDGAKTYPTDGSLNVTAVIEDGGPGSSLTLVQAFQGWLNAGMRLIPLNIAYPPEVLTNDNAAQQQQQEGAQQMASSQELAAIAALRYLGKPVTTTVLISSVEPGAPADGVLKPGDQVISIDGTPVHNYADVKDAISKVTPGDEVTLVIERDGDRQTLTIKTEASPDDPNQARVGVEIGQGFHSPIDVSIDLGNVGGPSGGLMFALSVIDKLTPESLTAGDDIAGTGTIDAKGNVGAIGGIEQKMAGAAAQGVDLFLAPGANCADVVGHIPDGLQVARVDTLDQAVNVLHRFEAGDTDLPTCDASP